MKPWRRDSREQKCHGHHRRNCWRKCSTHWFYPLRVLAAQLAPSHTSPPPVFICFIILKQTFHSPSKSFRYQTTSGLVLREALQELSGYSDWRKSSVRTDFGLENVRGQRMTKTFDAHRKHPGRNGKSDSFWPEGAGSSLMTDNQPWCIFHVWVWTVQQFVWKC